MYRIKDISPRDLNIQGPDDFQEKFNNVRKGANSFEELVNSTSYADIFPQDVIKDVDKNIQRAQDELDKIKQEASKAYKISIVVPLGGLVIALGVAIGFLIKAGFDFTKARSALAIGYRIIHGVSSQFYDALTKLEKSQAFIVGLNNRDDLDDKQRFEHFEDSGHHDYVLDALKFINQAVNHIDGRTGILKSGISDKILEKRLFKYTNELKKQTDNAFVPMKRGRVPDSGDIEKLIVTLTTLIDNINDLSSDINRVTDVDLNSTFGPFLYAILGKYVKFGDV